MGENGIPSDYPTRVVREDPIREGLLYAGTEFGLFVSLDDGANWQAFQQNLPVTPVTDIRAHRGDLVLATMGRSFWVLDSVAALRQDAMQNPGPEPVLFEPADTIRFRDIYSAADEHPVPDYPAPAVMIDYYLPDEAPSEITLEILDAGGALVNAYRSQSPEDEAEPGDEEEQHVDDMRGEILPITDETLTVNAGGNRFRWDMTHRGAWHEDEDKRYRNGPMAAPGIYRARLSAGDTLLEQEFSLTMDPRVIAGGTSERDVADQLALQLQLVALLSEARQFEHDLGQERDEFESARESGALSDAESERLATIESVLQKLETQDIIYPQPMLTNQIAYLNNMLGNADQAPGREAQDRFRVLVGQFDAVRRELE